MLRRKCSCGGGEHECDECKSRLRRKSAGWNPGPDIAPPLVHDALRSHGEPLDAPTRHLMETRFGHDFGRVRVHTDAVADASARAVNALAYTVGGDVVFASGVPSLGSEAGRRLLAHELAHVVQGGSARDLTGEPLTVGSVDDPAERAADTAAQRVVAGDGPITPSCVASTPMLRRQVRNSVVTDFQKGARACVLHLHGEERTALAVGKEIRGRRCVNFMHLDTTKRHIDFEFTVSGVEFAGQADPNRIFTAKGRKTKAILETHPKKKSAAADAIDDTKVKTAAEQVLQEFADQTLVPKIDECRKDAEQADASLPVMALHNNENLTPDKDVASTERSPNPSKGDPSNPSDFMLVTQKADFDALKGKHNVILQENPVDPDDGSLSVLLAGSRYVNVEKEGRQHDKPVGTGALKKQDDFYVKNYAMADAVLTQFGVPTWPCSASPNFERRTRSMFNRRLGHSGRKPTALSTDKPVFDREKLPENAPAGCILFADQPALDRRADEWRTKIEGMPLLNIIHWVLGGGDFTPPEAAKEYSGQQRCLIDAMGAGLKGQGLALPKGDITKSEQRSAKDQKGIWSRKFAFTGAEFDRISDAARAKCPALGTDVRWNPKNKDHEKCWKQLTDDEKQQEILSASSAPGVSRHHAGVDFDFGQTEKDLDPKAWTGTGAFADAYRWLARNASTYGFIQPFDTKGGQGVGYMSERWHWSYYPVAQAALEFIMDHDDEVEAALLKLWSDGKGGIKPEFSFIAKNWRNYVFNVEQLGVF